LSELEMLYRVQELDNGIRELYEHEKNHPLKSELEELETKKAAKAEELEAATASFEESRRKQSVMEQEEKRLEEKQRREEGKLYGGEVSNPKELRGLQAEVRSIGKQKDTLETELLEEMEHLDELDAVAEGIRSRVEELETEMSAKRGMLESETKEIRERLAVLKNEKAELRSGIGDELLELYDSLLGNKQKLAVVKVIDGVCQGCRVELPGVDYDRFLKTDDVFRCTNCGRIMIK
jgi:predicted  nucleic acid-binding Zn-ribbon protein